MSGLLMRSVLVRPLAKMVSATRAPNNHTTCLGPMGPTDCLAPWIDLILPSTPLAAPAQPVRRTRPT